MEAITCWTCGEPLAAHTSLQHATCDAQPVGDTVAVIHGNVLDHELMVMHRILRVLSQLQVPPAVDSK